MRTLGKEASKIDIIILRILFTYIIYSGGHFLEHILTSKLELFFSLSPIVKRSMSFEAIAFCICSKDISEDIGL